MIVPKYLTYEIARELVGRDIVPILFNIDDKEPKRLAIDRFACDDDGYYLLNARLRVPTDAILMRHCNFDTGVISLELDEFVLEERRLCELPWQ